MRDSHGNLIEVGDKVQRVGYPSNKAHHFTVLEVYPERIKINKANWIRGYTIVESRCMLLAAIPKA